jgi:hypothetical protein
MTAPFFQDKLYCKPDSDNIGGLRLCTEYKASSSAASDFRRSNYSLRKGWLSIPPSDGGGRRPPGRWFPESIWPSELKRAVNQEAKKQELLAEWQQDGTSLGQPYRCSIVGDALRSCVPLSTVRWNVL